MKKKLSFIAFLLLGCITFTFSQERIIGGYAVDISQRPFQAAVYTNYNNPYSFGGGVIISNEWIITAAHVVKDNNNKTYPPSNISVVTGYTSFNLGQLYSIPASQIIVHPNYNSSTFANDIALIKLSSPITYGTNRQPVMLRGTYSHISGTSAIVSGWGRRTLEDSSSSLSQLYAANVTVQSCTNNKIEVVPSTTMSYKGDSGGPLTVSSNSNTILAGIVSHSTSSNSQGPTAFPTTYTNVGFYYDWIKSYVSVPAISGPSRVCSTGVSCTLSNASASAWTCSPNLEIVSSNGTSAVIKSKYNGKSWVRATINGVTIASHDVWSGAPVINSISGPSRTPNGQYATFEAVYDYECSPQNFEWILNPVNGNSVYGGGPSCDIAFYNAGSYQIVVRATNSCGTGDYCTSGVNVYNSNSYSSMAFPNPASSTLYVKFFEAADRVLTNEKVATAEKVFDIRLYNIRGEIVRSVKSNGEQKTFDVSNLLNGNYFMHIYEDENDKPQIQQIIIKH